MTRKGDETASEQPATASGVPTAHTNGRVTLAAVDFLELTEQRKIACVDLTGLGRKGVVYVCDLPSEKQVQIFRPKGKRRTDKHGATEIDFKDMPFDAGVRLMEECLITDEKGGTLLEARFQEAADELGVAITDVDYIFLEEGDFLYMKDIWLRDKNVSLKSLRERLGRMGSEVVNAISAVVNKISGINQDDDEEDDALDAAKKD